MYSSLYEGFVRDPEMMVIPVDDHLVHRGDGIFEAMRFHDHKIFELEGHLNRLLKSAELIGMQMPKSRAEIEFLCQEIVDHSPDHGMLRLLISRGHGDFSANPYTTVGSQLILITMPFKGLPAEKYEQGASVVFSRVPVKQGFFAQVKSCNYLPNVLAKKDSVDRDADFALTATDDGYVAEGPTENLLLLTPAMDLVAPVFDYTLRGTTLLRVLDIARRHAKELGISSVGLANVSKAALLEAREVMMVGTTLGVLPVTRIEGKSVHGGVVGPVARMLNMCLEQAMGLRPT